MKHALVLGSTGVIGGSIVKQLLNEGEWRVTCVNRSGTAPQGADALALDILDDKSFKAALKSMPAVTHLFYAAYQPRSSRFLEIEPNLDMLRRAIDLAEVHAGSLQRVVLITGGKYYGLQWGAIKTPARETDPRHLAPNFYYQQHDHLVERSIAGGWSWSHLIPPYVTGYSERAPMNLVMTLGVLGTLSRAQKVPLRFPGTAAAWNALHHIADADQIAAAACWASTSENAGNEIFNIANGDPSRWKNTWAVLARYFDMEMADPIPVPLDMVPEAFGDLWKSISLEQGLVQNDIGRLVNWQWAHYMFNVAFSNDVLFETGKIRRAGFHQCLDTETTLLARFDELVARKLIPDVSR
ncbi:NAD-dependent epimerase/dehydratase family protein [Orrella marina]|uniref:NAD-dependent dehydratase n=1 Tax=Orrella marina TaxID=2163011 RepID=A0A2R4XHF7_9BURK|nr:NAD-dependent epimerase/dehydratase family protein [Orrella marina]AWB33163.1 NAD-dependent dehydratase [Orrella marina]